jgi:DNA-binding winged helix-turn-helix (wHTH) protein/tetratricopeptide (TPR) repeat protein
MDVKTLAECRYRFGPFLVDPTERVVTRDGVPVALTFRVFETLLVLVRNAGRVLTKDELLEAIWPGRFMEEGSLKQAVFTLRKALSGESDDTQYIVTAPGRGYSFTAAVERIEPRAIPQVRTSLESPASPPATPAVESEAPLAAARENRARFGLFAVGASAVAIATVLVAVILLRNLNSSPSPPKVVVLSDMQNLTGDAALGTVLGRVLEIDLAQSPYLNLLSPQQVSDTLQLMVRPKDAKLTPDLARQVCARNQGAAVLSGAVAAMGSRYVVTLEARDCGTGQTIAQGTAEASSREDLPNSLDALTVRVREGLNESAASLARYDVPIAQATTSSFDALKTFSLGEQLRGTGDNAAALPLFKHAVELDPSFALAYAEAGSAAIALRESELGKQYYRKAFELRDRTSENEKLRISAVYYERLGNFVAAAHSYQLWTATYPQDWLPWAHLSNLLASMAQYNGAIDAGRNALKLNPEHYGPYSVLTRAYKRATRFADARATGQIAVAKGLDGWDMHGLLYEIAFAERDQTSMAIQVAKEKSKATEPWMLDYEAMGAATAGQLRQSRALFEQAITLARAQGADSREEVEDFYEDYISTLATFGLRDEARRLVLDAGEMNESEYAPSALALAGDYPQAIVYAAALQKREPDSTEVNDADLPLTKAAIALGRDKPNDAIAALKPALPYELRDFWTASFLGQAYLEIHAPEKAAVEYRKILANRGVDGLSPLYPLACLGLARALHAEGRIPQSREAYEQLFAFWKDADSDLPVLQDARREYARISVATRTTERSPN